MVEELKKPDAYAGFAMDKQTPNDEGSNEL
jgi:hypothetical protein